MKTDEKIIRRRHRQTDKYKATKRRYRQTDKYKASVKHLRQSEKEKATTKHYQQSDRYKAIKKHYKQSDKGKAHELKYQVERRSKVQSAELVSPAEIFYRDKNICQLCKEPINWNDYNLYPTLDHIIPISKNGAHTKNNIQLAHRICNLLKNNNQDKLITWDEWIKYKLSLNLQQEGVY